MEQPTDFQKEWAKKNRVPDKTSIIMKVMMPVLVWVTCFLNLFTAMMPDETPKVVYNLTVGLTWAYILLNFGLVVLITIITPLSVMAMFGFKLCMDNPDEESSKKFWANMKSNAADRISYEGVFSMNAWSTCKTIFKAALLFGGHAFIAGIVLLCCSAWVRILTAVDRLFTVPIVQSVITPEKVAAIESAMPTGSVQETKMLPAK